MISGFPALASILLPWSEFRSHLLLGPFIHSFIHHSITVSWALCSPPLGIWGGERYYLHPVLNRSLLHSCFSTGLIRRATNVLPETFWGSPLPSLVLKAVPNAPSFPAGLTWFHAPPHTLHYSHI